ncbi:TrmH family RNA methyltransferase [Fontibacillus phaseoli]|uniref:TrmH family RNA methyltransferase n=1 Tax=Fontibacillus phaseoli TaxID=1416533 RepID=A0A369BJ66_9BACL|nr:TrmH family RNA methyltransferase [Fontibacillus phaseoli]RCX20477.1 TrmH family RNA methyltransferase [Fontibacillus phaseoli]
MISTEIALLLDKYRHKIKAVGMHHEKIAELRRMLNHGTADQSGLRFAAEGMWSQQKLLMAGLPISAFYFCPECAYSREAFHLAQSMIHAAGEVCLISKKVLGKLVDRDKPDGFLSVAELPMIPEHELELILPDNALVMVLDGLESPGNIGTILRSCDGAGVDALLICNPKVRLTHPKLIKASMGAAFVIPMVCFAAAEHCVDWLVSRGYEIYLADSSAEECYKAARRGGNTALVAGSERYGLSEAWHGGGDAIRKVSIPMHGICDSLNVGIAASILIYEISTTPLD